MAKKSVADLRRVETDEAHLVAEMKHELFNETYDQQDKATRELIDKIAHQLRVYNTTEMDEPWLGMSIQWLALEIVKDLAITGIQLGTFTFPEGICAVCGGEA